jgi:coenzyme PQQ precursor peptide PqqA
VRPCICTSGQALNRPCHWTTYEEHVMSWKSPRIVEIALGAEINSYACAEAKK